MNFIQLIINNIEVSLVIGTLLVFVVIAIVFDDDKYTPFTKNLKGNNTKKNEEVRSLYREYHLSKKQRRDIHDLISKQGLSRNEIEQVIIAYLGNPEQDETENEDESNGEN